MVCMILSSWHYFTVAFLFSYFVTFLVLLVTKFYLISFPFSLEDISVNEICQLLFSENYLYFTIMLRNLSPATGFLTVFFVPPPLFKDIFWPPFFSDEKSTVILILDSRYTTHLLFFEHLQEFSKIDWFLAV